jgi:hypothetical protein
MGRSSGRAAFAAPSPLKAVAILRAECRRDFNYIGLRISTEEWHIGIAPMWVASRLGDEKSIEKAQHQLILALMEDGLL